MIEFSKDPFGQFAEIIIEDVRKFGKKDENGKLSIDTGYSSQKVGEIHEEKIDIWDYDSKGNKKINIENASNFLIKKFVFKTIPTTKDFETYIFNGKTHDKIGTGFIKVEIEKLVGEICNNYIVGEILGKVQRKTAMSREDFEKTPKHIIPFSNVGYNVKTKQAEEYKHEWNFKKKLNAPFIKGMNAPNFIKFLRETLYEEDWNLIQELFGFVLYREYFLKKGFIFVGAKNTGKTTLINVLVAIIGIQNCSGLSLQKIGGAKAFDMASLYEKYLNFYDDLSSKDLIDNSGFKVATGGGYITAEQKFGDLFQFMSFAKLLFATNKIPPVRDLEDDAHFLRNVIIQFDNEISEEEIEPELINQLTTEEEKAGIVNWALRGLHRLFENKKFSYNKTLEEIKELVQRSANPLYSFVGEVLERENGSKITKKEMFNVYSNWCLESKKPRFSIESLGRQLPKHCNYILGGKNKERLWINAKIKEKYKKYLNTDTSDTFQKNIRKEMKDDVLPLYMFEKNVSVLSKKPCDNFEECHNHSTRELRGVPLCEDCYSKVAEGFK